VGYEAGMCLLVPRCGPRKSMRVILGILKAPGPGWSRQAAMAAIVRARELFWRGARVGKRGWAGLCGAGHWLSRFFVIT
jgi:hypothetical protein